MSGEYLITAANGMFELVSKRPNPRPTEISIAASIGCRALERLIEDRDFLMSLAATTQLQQVNQDDVDIILGRKTLDREHFKSFLSLEKRILIQSGMNRQFVNALVAQAETLLDEIRLGHADPDMLVKTVGVLKTKTCGLAYALEEALHTKRVLDRITFALGGAAIVVINVSIFASNGDLSPAGSAVSGILGSKLIEFAVKSIQEQ